MTICESISDIQDVIANHRFNGHTIAFVPTMGALHDGHISLIKAAQKKADKVVCSIYINPTQFNNAEDLKNYPRNITDDIKKLESAGCDILFTPSDDIMYHTSSTLKFDFGELDKVLEGAYRPNHFSGVALVVSKLFHIVQPDFAFFGQKDLQQLTIIRKLVYELLFNIEINSVQIQREKDGLAMSSRNGRLNPKERKEAVIFYQSLTTAQSLLKSGADRSTTIHTVEKLFEGHLAQLEYFEIVNDQDLKPRHENYLRPDTVLCIAGYIGNVRLIDNMYLIS
ncbi:pantoate--beta-alanine ligase [Marivirga sp. S37H4]|uniref:Pantothenate synthetase n=1 Tax=Marivirga aurantiaca TaxID=2802615 RepID=A0A934WZG7_9BACT|nr:pantoate--beta-alanine ligase [Marivirga aurantiaca]MBK6265610.1 pantoate--beta-alanine ligase [Marivirga aurantiaca]